MGLARFLLSLLFLLIIVGVVQQFITLPCLEAGSGACLWLKQRDDTGGEMFLFMHFVPHICILLLYHASSKSSVHLEVPHCDICSIIQLKSDICSIVQNPNSRSCRYRKTRSHRKCLSDGFRRGNLLLMESMMTLDKSEKELVKL